MPYGVLSGFMVYDDFAFEVIQWTFGGVAGLFTCGRFCVRLIYNKRIGADDVLNGFALICLFAYSALIQVNADDEYDLTIWYKLLGAATILAWSTPYFVKASFLALCWSIFNVSASFRKTWMIVSAYTFVTFLAIILASLWGCGSPQQYGNGYECGGYVQPHDKTMLMMSLILHASSEFLIMALPLIWIRQLHMSIAQKASVVSVFVIVIVDIVLGILRLTALMSYYNVWNVPADAYGYDNVDIAGYFTVGEPAIAVIVCTLPAYKVLLPSSRKRRREASRMQRQAATLGEVSSSRRTLRSEGESISMTKRETVSIV